LSKYLAEKAAWDWWQVCQSAIEDVGLEWFFFLRISYIFWFLLYDIIWLLSFLFILF
jgi:hypothetical protein